MPNTGRSSASPWLTLLLAGGFEIGYALSVGGSHGFTRLTWSLVAVVFFLLTLWALSVALRTIEVSIGYAVWAGIGSAGAALLGPVFFNETLTAVQALWLGVIIVGVIWLKLADRPQKTQESADSPQDAQGISAGRRKSKARSSEEGRTRLPCGRVRGSASRPTGTGASSVPCPAAPAQSCRTRAAGPDPRPDPRSDHGVVAVRSTVATLRNCATKSRPDSS